MLELFTRSPEHGEHALILTEPVGGWSTGESYGIPLSDKPPRIWEKLRLVGSIPVVDLPQHFVFNGMSGIYESSVTPENFPGFVRGEVRIIHRMVFQGVTPEGFVFYVVTDSVVFAHATESFNGVVQTPR